MYGSLVAFHKAGAGMYDLVCVREAVRRELEHLLLVFDADGSLGCKPWYAENNVTVGRVLAQLAVLCTSTLLLLTGISEEDAQRSVDDAVLTGLRVGMLPFYKRGYRNHVAYIPL
jgi:hypothetical protein